MPNQDKPDVVTQETRAPPKISTEDREEAMSLGIRFDGLDYHYKDYRYNRLGDALRYARLDQTHLGQIPEAAKTFPWPSATRPDAAAQALMSEFGIHFDGRSYRYQEYRYDRLDDAVNYAGKKKPP